MKYVTAIAAAAAFLGTSASEARPLRLFARTPASRVPRAQPVPYHWTQGAAPKAHQDMVSQFGRVGLKPGEYVWASAPPAQGDPHIVVDLLTQMAYAYRGDRLVGASTISSAK